MAVFKADPAEHRDHYGLLVWGRWYFTHNGFAYGPYMTEDDANAQQWNDGPDNDEEPEDDEPDYDR